MAKRPLDEANKKQLQNIGKRLKQLRIEKGYTNYEQFAYEHDIPRAQYGRYERGEDLKLSSLLKVLQGLDISLKDFFAEGF
ncbi:MAG TPA: helix-turn-helix transcriptional regulator [Cytophagales bacterium]|nr:helix-turn-helix transcriptional regulator [Cytophagales bacterium]